MRKQPEISPPQTIAPKQLDNVITQVREYQLITPLYGGGVNPNEADPITIVRATEIRGHLRFWWRACRGGMFDGNAKKMWEKENELWGKAYKKDDPIVAQTQTIQITVDVDPSTQGKPVKPFVITEKRRPQPANGIPDYAAFPLQPDQDKLKEPDPYIPDVQKDVSFTLTISFPEDRRKDMEAALWAWETFGGIGGRTRRGFGALHLLKIDGVDNTDLPPSHSVEQWINSHLVSFIEGDVFPTGIPHLSTHAQCIITAPSAQPAIAWKVLIGKLRYFRQAGRPRRGIWPEAEAIRKITRRRYLRYRELEHPQKFPRAAFGLPIIFHFKDTSAGDPKDTTLIETSNEKGNKVTDKEEKQGRFASPLLLRPFLCRDNRAVGLALLLEGSRVDLENLTLAEKGNGNHAVQGTLTKSEAINIEILKDETDVLQAFMKSLRGV